jgi:hypothetical protein
MDAWVHLGQLLLWRCLSLDVPKPTLAGLGHGQCSLLWTLGLLSSHSDALSPAQEGQVTLWTAGAPPQTLLPLGSF